MADYLISGLPAALGLSGTDLMEVEQGANPANTSGKATLLALQTYILTGLTFSAVDVDISDVGGYYTGTEVEAALAQLGPLLSVVPVLTVNSVGPTAGNIVLSIAGLTSVQTVTTTATLTPVATNDKVVVSAQVGAILIATPSGTAAEGQGFVIAIYSAAAAAISFSVDYRAMGAALPTTTVAGKWTYIPVMRNQTDSKWDVFAVSQQT